VETVTPKTKRSGIDAPSDAEQDRPHVPDAFSVSDAASANWLVRKIVEARAYALRVAAWADREGRRAKRDEQWLLGHYGAELEAWVRRQVQKGRRKSIGLPAGTVGFRAEPQRLSVADEQALMAWCRANLPAALRVETHVLKGAVKDHVAATGDLPIGAEITGGGERFYIK
jgi:hypothetical protein